jgi:hypothetical protein
MHKGINLSLKLWVEGDDEPSHDFAQYTMKAVREMLAAGYPLYPQLHVDIRSMAEDTDWEEDTTEK